MYKVMLVDDELLVRIGLRSMVHWEELGFSITAEASNGEQAYEKYLALNPDIIITDLKMPKKDGFWLIKKIKEHNPEAEIIVLTCYDEFDFAREALKLQVSDYLLKAEMEETEIRQAMLEKKDKLDKKRQHLNNVSNTETGDTNFKSYDRLLGLLLNPTKSMESVQTEFQNLSLPRKGQHYCFLQLDFSSSLKDSEYAREQTARILSVIMQLTANRFSNTGIQCLSKQFGKSITCFLISESFYQHTLNREIEDIKLVVMQYFNVTFKSVNSPIEDDVEKAREHSNWLVQAADRMFYCSLGVHIPPDVPQESTSPQTDVFQSAHVAMLCECIEYNNLSKVKTILNEIKQTCIARNESSMNAKLLLIHYVNDIVKQCSLYLNDLGPDIMAVQKELLDSSDIDEAISILLSLAQALSLHISSVQVDNSDILIRKATDYISQHYTEKISLEDVATSVGISKYYLSNMFKKIQGINFSSHLNNVRIEKAKMLLKNPQITVAQICEQVGFHDQQYFSKIFKKHTGMTVTEYRKRKAMITSEAMYLD